MSNPVGGIGMLVSWDGDRKHQSGQSSRLRCFVGFLDSNSDHPLMIQQNVFLCQETSEWTIQQAALFCWILGQQ